jgi:NADPH:quinone reductase-like Zn-dependent oxidoreductase
VRAVTFDRYGPPEVLRLAEVERPAPADDEVLVRVHATTATRSDCGLRSAEYLVARLFTGVLRPRRGRIGLEFAGEVESIGAAVSELAVGDRVFGIGSGTNAEYVCVSAADAIARIPSGLTFEEAAGIADGGLSAMSLLRSAGLRQAGGSSSTARPVRSASAPCRSRSTSEPMSPRSAARRASTSCARSAPTR